MLERTPGTPAERAINGGGRRSRYVFFAVASLALLMSPGSATTVATVLPAIERSLQAVLA